MRIANISPGPRFLYAQGRARLIEPGEAVELELTEAEAANARRQVEAGLLAWGDEPPRAAGPRAVHRGFGRFHIVGPDGEELAGPLRKEQVATELARLGQGG
ncbi:hypothetical protein KXR53_17060 [Inquilinus limosus]|uniref:hypothetical protein n=1 Tax=Inquilinus limosus TaxID=171674 RepID=UPI003F145AF9